MRKARIILASKSPRRKEILKLCGFEPEIIVSSCDESEVKEKDPKKLVAVLSEMKGEDVAGKCEAGDLIVAADTVVVLDKRILGKPKTKKEAFEMLQSLQGRNHEVYTGVTLIYRKKGEDIKETFVEKTVVTVSPMTNCEIRAYINTGEPMDKAGAYGIQGAFGKFIPGIKGDVYSVVGLPLEKTYHHIKAILK